MLDKLKVSRNKTYLGSFQDQTIECIFYASLTSVHYSCHTEVLEAYTCHSSEAIILFIYLKREKIEDACEGPKSRAVCCPEWTAKSSGSAWKSLQANHSR